MPRTAANILAFGAYLALSLFFFGRRHVYGTSVFGYGGDTMTSVWCLAWWPWAIAHGLNPFVSHQVWYPHGVNLTWVTSTPALALVGLPLTLAFGAIVTFNTLTLLAPAFGAWSAFLLARHLTRDVPASLVAGYLYGFSSYEIGHLTSHINLDTICLVPLLLLVCLRRLSGDISARRCVVLLTLGLLAQFGISLEVLCTACVFGAVAWLVFLRAARPEQRPGFHRLAREFIISGALVALLASPYLLFMARGLHTLPPVLNAPELFSNDPLAFLVPSVMSRMGNAWFALTSARFVGGPSEQTAYLGLPLILILVACFSRRLGEPAMQAMLAVLLLLIVCSLGPVLWVDGTRTRISLPWRLAAHIPLLRNALPGRFSLYVALLSGLVVAFWLAERCTAAARVRRLSLACLACLFLLPDPVTAANWTSAEMLPFFADARAKALLKPDQNVLLLPFGQSGPSMIWQWQARYGFTQSGGYTGLTPRAEAVEPVVLDLGLGRIPPNFAAMLLAYCRGHRVSAIIAGPRTDPALLRVIGTIGWPARREEGVVLFSNPDMQGPAR